MPVIPPKYQLLFAGFLLLTGIATTAYWVDQNDSCTVTRRTTVQETGETIITNETISSGFAPALCSMDSTSNMLMGGTGPMLTLAGAWFTVRTLI